MTLKTWRDEFMPKMPTKRMTKRQAVEHSLRKWEGLTKKNLKKHGVFKSDWFIEDDNDDVSIDANTCALCVKYFDAKTDILDTHDDECRKCPLFKTLGEPCDGRSGSQVNSPYNIWRLQDNPLPMIKALRKTLASLED